MSLPPSKADLAACARKTRWGSERAARWALANIRRGGDNRMRPEIRAYRCRVRTGGKGHWHLGGAE